MTLYNRLLIKLSIRPYKVVELDTQLLVKHYRNGRIEATRMSQKKWEAQIAVEQKTNGEQVYAQAVENTLNLTLKSNGVSRLYELGLKGQSLKSVCCAN